MDTDEEPTGPRVIMCAAGERVAVLIEPPLPTGDHRRVFGFKDDAWSYARELWSKNRLGFCDETVFRFGQTGSIGSRTKAVRSE